MQLYTFNSMSQIILKGKDVWAFYNTKTFGFLIVSLENPAQSLAGRFANLSGLELDVALRLNSGAFELTKGELINWVYCDTCCRLEEVDSPHYPKGK